MTTELAIFIFFLPLSSSQRSTDSSHNFPSPVTLVALAVCEALSGPIGRCSGSLKAIASAVLVSLSCVFEHRSLPGCCFGSLNAGSSTSLMDFSSLLETPILFEFCSSMRKAFSAFDDDDCEPAALKIGRHLRR